MALCEITSNAFRPIATSSVADMNLKELADLQRLPRPQIGALDENPVVLTEEFSDWETLDTGLTF